jgi:hypothetical protein
MRTLDKEFTMAPDKGGLMEFNLIKREGDVALYKRSRPGSESNPEFEVFLVKKRFKGQPLPGGVFEKEDRECYPGAASFGKTAFFCNTLGNAEKKFLQLRAKEQDINERKDESEKTGEKVKRGRKKAIEVKVTATDVVELKTTEDKPRQRGRRSVDRTQLQFPSGEWTMKQAHDLNPNCCHATVWTYLKQLVKVGEMEVCGTIPGRGKPKLLYRRCEPKVSEKGTAVKDGMPF